MKGFLLLRINGNEDIVNLIALTIPCKTYDSRKTRLNEKEFFFIAKDIDFQKINMEELKNNPHITEIILRKEELGESQV